MHVCMFPQLLLPRCNGRHQVSRGRLLLPGRLVGPDLRVVRSWVRDVKQLPCLYLSASHLHIHANPLEHLLVSVSTCVGNLLFAVKARF